MWTVGLVLAVLLALLVGLNVGGLRQRVFGRPSPPAIRSLAVLPLENLSGDEAQEYFADGMTDELITDLASIARLRVISRTSTTHYKGTRKTIPEIARELNVDAVVEGSVGRSPNKVRIRAQLIRAAPEEHLWAQSYERDLPDVLALQRDVASAIANEIKIHLTPQERQHLASARPINPDAYNAFLLGDYHSNKRNRAAMEKGIQYFQEAIRIDPSYARAYAGLASAYIERDIWGGLGVGKSADQVRAATLKALELDGELAEAHALLGQIHFQYDWDWQGTEAEYKRAIQLNPNLAGSYVRYAYFLQAMRRHTEALAAAHRAVELDPLSAANLSDEGRILYRARQYESAIARYQRALELDPRYVPALSRMADAYEEWGKYDQALAAVQKFQQAAADPRDIRLPLGRLYARTGRRPEAIAIERSPRLRKEFKRVRFCHLFSRTLNLTPYAPTRASNSCCVALAFRSDPQCIETRFSVRGKLGQKRQLKHNNLRDQNPSRSPRSRPDHSSRIGKSSLARSGKRCPSPARNWDRAPIQLPTSRGELALYHWCPGKVAVSLGPISPAQSGGQDAGRFVRICSRMRACFR
jgi:TolB-like protein/Tfp pilus assembly protein PilF